MEDHGGRGEVGQFEVNRITLNFIIPKIKIFDHAEG